jgi:Uma2 family endonuclease
VDQNPVVVLPDLVVEVLSPDDRPGRVADKLMFYARAGIPLLWLIDPEEESLTVYRPGEPPEVHTPGDVIDAGPVLRGFRLELAELFAVLRREKPASG